MGTIQDTGKNAMLDALTALVDSGNAVIYTSGDVEVATIGLAANSFGAASSGSAAIATTTDDSDATGGEMSYLAFETSGGTEHWRATIGTSGADINVGDLTVAAGATVSISSYSVSVS